MYWPIRLSLSRSVVTVAGEAVVEATRRWSRNQDETSAPIMPRPLPDSIEEMMKRIKGQTIADRTPHNLSDAIQRVAGKIDGPEAAAELRK